MWSCVDFVFSRLSESGKTCVGFYMNQDIPVMVNFGSPPQFHLECL